MIALGDLSSAATIVVTIVTSVGLLVKIVVRNENAGIKEQLTTITKTIAEISTELAYIKRDLERLQSLPERVGRLEADMARLDQIFIRHDRFNDTVSRLHERLDEAMRVEQ